MSKTRLFKAQFCYFHQQQIYLSTHLHSFKNSTEHKTVISTFNIHNLVPFDIRTSTEWPVSFQPIDTTDEIVNNSL